MKTYYFSSKSIPAYSLMGLMCMLLASCGSYKNSYDNDGVYGSGTNTRQEDKTTASDSHYKNYFDSLQEDSQVFTDVDNYNTTEVDSTQTDNEAYASDNGGWGSNSDTTVIVYDNDWGYNPWYYGSSWGFGYYGGWGWGLGWGYSPWCNWGYGYPYYGGYYGNYYHNNYYGYGRGRTTYAYNAGRGRTSYSNSNGLGRSSGRSAYTPGRRSTSTSYSTRSGYNNRNTGTRNIYNGNNRSQGRNAVYTPTRNNNTSLPTRNNNSSTPTRSYSPSPSYTPSSSSGGGRSGGGNSGGGGGGRSGGGGGGRRG